MLYFNEFNNINYNFGNETDKVVFQNISLYGDIIDQVKDNVTFANGHTIQEGFRPDQVSIQLYDTPLHYWTFYLLNAARIFSPSSKIIYSSTNKVYGDLATYKYSENTTRY